MSWAKLGWVVNILIHLAMAYFMIEVFVVPDDPRFAQKAIPIRNLLVVLVFWSVFPISQLVFKKWRRYPVWIESLFLSIFLLDMAGNSFNLYDSYYYFDLIPHFYGPGAVAVVLASGFAISPLGAIGVAGIVHILLEAQEYYTDVWLGTVNVRGLSDTINDLLVGVCGSILFMLIYLYLRKYAKS
jgi:hypothetical protein